MTVRQDTDGAYTAVMVNAGRATERGDSVPTFLMGTIAMDTSNVGAVSMAVSSSGAGVDDIATCHDAMFLSADFANTGSNNTFFGAVCIRIYGCETTHQSDLPIADAALSTGTASYGSVLYR
ncbi:MAG: hypothetical protein ACSHW1_20670 [Yoonia sp.]|uniref:hypothetical protein n=1 Tax=Yoonia sp. TaxID=2212373 RepID=UPI003EF17844